MAIRKQTLTMAGQANSSTKSGNSAILMATAAQIIGLALTAAGLLWQQHSINATSQAKFDQNAERLEAEVKRHFSQPLYGLMGARGMFAGSKSVNRSAFQAYVASRNLPIEFPGIRGFGFIEPVQRSDLTRFVAAEQADGAPDFAVRSSGDAPDLFVIKYIEPLLDNRLAQGFDIGQEPVRREAAQRAISSGQPALTGRILMQRNGQQPGFLYLVPVYKQGNSPLSAQQRQNALIGLLYAPIVAADLMQGVAAAADGMLDFALYDGDASQAANLLFDTNPHLSEALARNDGEAAVPALFQTTRYLMVGGRALALHISNTPVFDATIDRTSLAFVGLGGALGSFLLTLTVWLLAAGRLRAQNLANRMTADLDRLARVVQHTSNAVLITDPDMRINWVNNGFIRISGYTLAEVQGRTADELLSCTKVDPAMRQTLTTSVATGEACRIELPIQTKNGQDYWIDTELQPTRNEQGVLVGFMVIGTDITERKAAQAQLQLAASVFTHAREGIVITDVSGTIVAVNDTFVSITGYSHEDVQGKNPRMLNSGRQPPEYYAAMWRTLVNVGHWTGEVWNRRKNGEVYAEILTISAVRDDANVTQNYVALFTDITPIKEHQQQLEHIAHYDALTSLPNRILLADRLQQAIAQSRRHDCSLAVVFLDLDGFKAVNDQHGHGIGDLLLVELSLRMRDALREGDTLARIGGDEFVAVLVDLDQSQDYEQVLIRLLKAASDPVLAGTVTLQISSSIGVTLYPQDNGDADLLMRHADQAMYQAKQAGKNRYHVFDLTQDAAVKTQYESLDRIRLALDQQEFVLFYQPKVNMKTGIVIGAEALIRWQHPERGLLAPGDFLPIIEAHSISLELGHWVIATALAQMSQWYGAGHGTPVSVNIGALQLQQTDFVQRLTELLTAHPNVRPEHLELEILETSALEDMTQVSEVMQACQALGVRFALDDFGTGYSSLTYLKRLPAETLKIDQSFVHDMIDDPNDLAIIKGIIELATAFRREVIAEGVETAAHGALLLSMGCELAQGYGIARPMPASELPQWATAWNQRAGESGELKAAIPSGG